MKACDRLKILEPAAVSLLFRERIQLSLSVNGKESECFAVVWRVFIQKAGENSSKLSRRNERKCIESGRKSKELFTTNGEFKHI
jgi:hypothetical protein